MYKLCKTEQSARRQRELEQGLLTAMGSHQYDEISVSDLCDHLQIPRKSFYRYFSSKDGALHALIDHTLLEYEGFETQMTEGGRSYHKDLTRFFLFWKDRHTLLDALDRSDISGILVVRSVEHALSDIGLPTRFLPQTEQLVRRHATMFAVCGLMSMVLSWHKGGFELSAEDMAAIAVELVTRPLFAEAE